MFTKFHDILNLPLGLALDVNKNNQPFAMVLTRSAEKRRDAANEENLVLRSKIDPSTPIRSPKRRVTTRDNANSPRTKRARFGLDGAADAPPSHVVVRIPPRPNTWESDSTPRASIDEANARSENELMAKGNTPSRDEKDQATPKAGTISPADIGDQSSVAYETPATSTHKRFGSEEIDDDTILISASIDSSAPQGYQTAEEEMVDSDDDAPEIGTTKIAPKLPQRKSTRTPKRPKQKVTLKGNHNVASDEDEMAPGQPAASEPEASRDDDNEQEAAKTSSYESNMLTDGSALLNAPSLENKSTPTVLDSLSSRSDGPISTKASTVITPTLANASQGVLAPSSLEGTSKHEILGRVPEPASIAERANKAQVWDEQSMIATSERIPAKATSSLSSHRRKKLQQRVASSGGAFRMENAWSSKRRSFVIS